MFKGRVADCESEVTAKHRGFTLSLERKARKLQRCCCSQYNDFSRATTSPQQLSPLSIRFDLPDIIVTTYFDTLS